MSSDLQRLDAALHKVVTSLYGAYARGSWTSLRYCARWTPAGDVGADDFWWKKGDQWVKQSPTDINDCLAVSDAAKEHWQLTQALGQPRWYQMTVRLDENGRYSVDFAYRDVYEEGDIMEAVELPD